MGCVFGGVRHPQHLPGDAGCDGAGDEEAAEQRERREDEEDERREREMDASSMETAGYTPEEIERVTGINLPENEEELATNAARRFYKRDRKGRFNALGFHRKGSRSSKGNPKNPTTKSNTTLKAATGAKKQAQVDAAEKAIKRTATKGGRVEDAARVGESSLSIAHGMVGDKSNDFKGAHGSSHQQRKHGGGKENTTPRKVAQAAVLGKKSKDRKNGTVLSDYKGTQAALAVRGDKKNELISGYKRKKPKSGTQAN